MTINESIWADRDNSFTVKYQINADIALLPTPTKITFKLGGKLVDSDTNPEYFVSTLETDGEIEFKLGHAGYTDADDGLATVTIFDAVNTEGVVYSGEEGPTEIRINVVEAPEDA